MVHYKHVNQLSLVKKGMNRYIRYIQCMLILIIRYNTVISGPSDSFGKKAFVRSCADT